MFSCESLGIEDDQSQFDSDIIAEFERNIQFRDGRYWVKLPWFPDRIKNVPSNHGVSLKVLDIMERFSKENMYEDYLAVFPDQECEDKDVEEKAEVCNILQESKKKLWDFKRRDYGELTDAPDYFLIKSAFPG